MPSVSYKTWVTLSVPFLIACTKLNFYLLSTDLLPEMVYSVSFDGSLSSVSSVAMCLAEALCSIDEDNKHTEQIQKFLQQIQKPVQNEEDFNLEGISELMESCYPVIIKHF